MSAPGLVVRCGTVIASERGRCRVEMERERCAGCAGRCSAGLSLLGELALDVDAETATPPVGGRVSVGVPRRGMARAALVVFGLPLAAITAAAAGGEALGGAGAAGAALGLLAGGAGRSRVGPLGAACGVGAASARGAARDRLVKRGCGLPPRTSLRRHPLPAGCASASARGASPARVQANSPGAVR